MTVKRFHSAFINYKWMAVSTTQTCALRAWRPKYVAVSQLLEYNAAQSSLSQTQTAALHFHSPRSLNLPCQNLFQYWLTLLIVLKLEPCLRARIVEQRKIGSHVLCLYEFSQNLRRVLHIVLLKHNIRNMCTALTPRYVVRSVSYSEIYIYIQILFVPMIMAFHQNS